MAKASHHRRAVTLLALAALYTVTGKLSLALAFIHPSASAVWPPTGIALAAFLMIGRGAWPAILVGAFFVNATTMGNAATSLGIAVGNTLEGLAGAWLVERFAGGSAAFERPRTVFGFLALAGLLATTLSPSVGVTSLCLGGYAEWSRYGGIWLTWWLGDMGGAIVVTPALVLWARQPQTAWTTAQVVELGAMFAVIALVGTLAFGGLGPGERLSLSFLCLPVTIWTSFRFGPRKTATALLLLSGFAIWGALRGDGASTGGSEHEFLLVLQVFLVVFAATSLLLAAVVAENRRALGVLEDQTAELARSNADLDEFARVASHDLKAPLRGISSLAGWIADDCREILPAESRQHLALLEERAKRMGRLIDGVLRYSQVGQKRATPERVDARAIVEDVIDFLGPTPGISVRVEGKLPIVRYDPTQLTQVFQNLIQNAVQHLGKPSGEVVVSCRDRPRDFEFRVRDDGIGISEVHLESIFTMFHSISAEEGPAGVGLAIVKKIVEMHGGSVRVESTPGRGATFLFTIPKAPR